MSSFADRVAGIPCAGITDGRRSRRWARRRGAGGEDQEHLRGPWPDALDLHEPDHLLVGQAADAFEPHLPEATLSARSSVDTAFEPEEPAAAARVARRQYGLRRERTVDHSAGGDQIASAALPASCW
jgi:hypothetical protein